MNKTKLIQAIKNLKINNSRPILNNIFLKKDGTCFLTDLETGLTFEQSELDIVYAPECLININQLLKFSAKKDKINIDLGIKDDIVLKAGKTSLKLPNFDTNEYPINGEVEGREIELASDNILSGLESCIIYASKEKNRYSLDTIKIDFRAGYMISTDQIRLRAFYIEKQDIDSIVINTQQAKTLILLLKADKDCQLKIVINDASVKFKNDSWELICRQTEANFPNYIGAISNHSSNVGNNIKAKDMIEELKDLDLVLCEDHRNAKLEFNGTKTVVSTATPLGEMEIELSTQSDYQQEQTFIGFNPYFTLDYLKDVEKQSKGSKVSYHINGPKKPLVFKDTNGFYFMSPCAI